MDSVPTLGFSGDETSVMSEDRQRVLILAGQVTHQHPIAQALAEYFDVDTFDRMEEAMDALRHQTYHAVFADAGDFLPLERALVGQRSSLVLNTIGEGVCIVDADGRCSWSNNRMRAFAAEVFEEVRRICAQAMSIFVAQAGETPDRTRPRSKKFTLQEDDRYFELICSPVVADDGRVRQVVAVVWDATIGKQLQTKIDAIDASGRELARIDTDTVAKLAPSERLELLQDKIIKYSKDLMHFDHFAVRLLDKRTNKLEVVISEGLPTEALDVDLYGQPEGNGISGYVAATGRSYICHDTEKDARYVPGLRHCKSSLTVALMHHDVVVGVYNVESDSVGAFSEYDRQFAEIFGRHVALALNILDLLLVQRYTTSGQITDSMVQEMAQPLNDIVTEAQSLMEEYIGDDTMRNRLHRIVDNVESIRHGIRDVAAGTKTILGSQKHEPAASEPMFAGTRVLVADDEENIRQTIGDILRKHGCTVECCKDGHEAYALLEQQTYDLVISDIKMPYRNGYEIFAAAQRIRPSMPVMLMTGFGYDPHHSIVRASQQGLASVLFKPFKVDQLLGEVAKAVAQAAKASTGFQHHGSSRASPR